MARTERTPLPAVIQEQRDLGNKWCHGCTEFHPFGDFGSSKDRPDGLNPRCRVASRSSSQRNHANKMGERYRPRVCEAVKEAAPEGMTWCNIHATYCLSETFGRHPRKDNGIQSSCNRAQAERASARRTPPKRITSRYNPAPEGTRWCWWHKAFELEVNFYRKEKLCQQGRREKSKGYPEVNAAKSRRRRAKLREVEGSHTAAEIIALGESQQWKCANPLCRKDIRRQYDADHKTPISRGGSDYISNIDLKCQTCNRKKHTMTQEEWMQSLGITG